MDESMPNSRKREYYSLDEFVPNIRRREYSGSTKTSLADASKTPTTLPVQEPSPSPTEVLYNLPPKFSYDIFFSAELLCSTDDEDSDDEDCDDEDSDGEFDDSNWYKIHIHADGPAELYPEPVLACWAGKLPNDVGFAALGSHIYRFGGATNSLSGMGIRDVYKLQVFPCVANDWVPVSPMLSPRICPYVSVLGNKIFVCNYFDYDDDELSDSDSNEVEVTSSNSVPPSSSKSFPWGEVFDPVNEKWEAIPNPPFLPFLKCEVIALENPDRILVYLLDRGSDDDSDNDINSNSDSDDDSNSNSDSSCDSRLYLYNMQHGGSWTHLTRSFGPSPFIWEASVIVGNTIYWVGLDLKDEIQLFAYNIDLDMCLDAPLKVVGMDLCLEGCLKDVVRINDVVAFIHMENQRFCFLKREVLDHYLYCVIADVSQIPERKTLNISVVWKKKYAMESAKLSNLLVLRNGADYGQIVA